MNERSRKQKLWHVCFSIQFPCLLEDAAWSERNSPAGLSGWGNSPRRRFHFPMLLISVHVRYHGDDLPILEPIFFYFKTWKFQTQNTRSATLQRRVQLFNGRNVFSPNNNFINKRSALRDPFTSSSDNNEEREYLGQTWNHLSFPPICDTSGRKQKKKLWMKKVICTVREEWMGVEKFRAKSFLALLTWKFTSCAAALKSRNSTTDHGHSFSLGCVVWKFDSEVHILKSWNSVSIQKAFWLRKSITTESFCRCFEKIEHCYEFSSWVIEKPNVCIQLKLIKLSKNWALAGKIELSQLSCNWIHRKCVVKEV